MNHGRTGPDADVPGRQTRNDHTSGRDAAHRLDLTDLPSPVIPPWLSPTAESVVLPFAPATFDSAAIGRRIIDSTRLHDCFSELSRVLKPGGELDVTFSTNPGEVNQPTTGDILCVLGRFFQVRSVNADLHGVTIKARNDRNHQSSHRSFEVVSHAFGEYEVAAARSIAGLTQQHARLESANQNAQERLKQQGQELAKIREELTREGKALVAMQAALSKEKHNVGELTKRANTQQETLSRLHSEIALEHWRLLSIQSRKASRIADELRALRQPWLLPRTLWRVARITLTSPIKLPPPAQVGATLGEQKSNDGINTTAKTRVRVSPAVIPDAKPRRPDLVVATILDEFSELAFSYEFQTIPVPRHGWRELLDASSPNFLLVESAWNANNGAWQYAFTGSEVPKRDVLDLLEYCRDRGIVTVFWNKEDPLEYDLFIRSARHFDWVFTVDANCIDRYRADLRHERVGLLPFGVQPRIHNPINGFRDREGKVAFAGTYYSGKYPARQEQIEYLLKPVVDLGLHIFSRWESNPRYRFPDDLQPSVVGSLDYAQMLAAYRQYQVFLNVNSVTDSQTMFSRRVLELLACGTPVVSGPSPGMSAMLGDGIVGVSKDPETTRYLVRALLNSAELRDRTAVMGLRSVMTSHTYSHRVDHLLATIGLPVTTPTKRVSVIAPTNRAGGAREILRNVARQSHADVETLIALHGIGDDRDAVLKIANELGVSNVEVLTAPSEWSLGRVLNELCAMASGDFVAKMDDDDIYGDNYLRDQLLAFDYADADIVGKWSRFVYLEDVPCLGVLFPGKEHQFTELVGGGTILVKRSVLEECKFPDQTVGEDTQFLRSCGQRGATIYSTDRFNHVYVRAAQDGNHTFRPHRLLHLGNTRIVSFGTSTTHAMV